MKGQISMFEMLDDYRTPEIPIEEQKEGVRGWVIEISGIFLIKNGFKEDMIGVCTRPMIFLEDTKVDRYGRATQNAQTTHGPMHGWLGQSKTVYARRPTWHECLEYARKKYTLPEKVIYYEEDGDFNAVYQYENGYQKGA